MSLTSGRFLLDSSAHRSFHSYSRRWSLCHSSAKRKNINRVTLGKYCHLLWAWAHLKIPKEQNDVVWQKLIKFWFLSTPTPPYYTMFRLLGHKCLRVGWRGWQEVLIHRSLSTFIHVITGSRLVRHNVLTSHCTSLLLLMPYFSTALSPHQ